MINGRIPDSMLAPIPGGRLVKPYAVQWNAMCFVHRAKFGTTPVPNGAMSSYRTFFQQVFLRNQWCARGACQNAAVPGTSNHGLGRAVDNAFLRTVYAVGRACGIYPPSDAPWESWHALIRLIAGFKSSHGSTGDSKYPIIRKGTKNAKAIIRLQKLLRGGGYTKIVNGSYGIWTRRAVRKFQQKHGMKVDGVVGPATWKKLYQLFG
jgi:hypothetical protein